MSAKSSDSRSTGTLVLRVAFTVAVLLAESPAIAPAAAATFEDATAGNAAGVANDATPKIVAIYPNPVTEGDSGEFVVVRFPSRTDAGDWSLSDGESTVELPNATVSGRVVFSSEPDTARNRTDLPVFSFAGDLALANGGETVRLATGEGVASTVTYADAPEGERWHRAGASGTDWQWTPLGATDFEIAQTGPATARTFVLPDAPDVPIEPLRQADRRILLAGYTLTSSRVADALTAAVRRGVQVRVLVDGAPVGGLTHREAQLLDSLVARGVEVRAIGGPLARYDFHHAKYAVADDRALVLTENWKPAGTGGRASRGWGIELRDEATADRLAAVFRADAEWRGAVAWSEFRRGKRFETESAANGSYSTEFDPETFPVESTEILVAPDNAEKAHRSLLRSANESIRIQQVAIGSRRHSLLQATLQAARRGVEVRLLLSSAWYVAEDNQVLVEWLNEVAEQEGLPLEARLADPRDRYEKIHTKGVVVDGETVVIGSLNWNNHSARSNREVAVVARGEALGSYYVDVFDSDWRASAGGGLGSGGRVPVGLLVGIAIGSSVALLFARREVAFEKYG